MEGIIMGKRNLAKPNKQLRLVELSDGSFRPDGRDALWNPVLKKWEHANGRRGDSSGGFQTSPKKRRKRPSKLATTKQMIAGVADESALMVAYTYVLVVASHPYYVGTARREALNKLPMNPRNFMSKDGVTSAINAANSLLNDKQWQPGEDFHRRAEDAWAKIFVRYKKTQVKSSNAIGKVCEPDIVTQAVVEKSCGYFGTRKF